MKIINFSNKHLYGPSTGLMLFTILIVLTEYGSIGLNNSAYILFFGIIIGYLIYKLRIKGSFLVVGEKEIILVNNKIIYGDIVELKIISMPSNESLETGMILICKTESREYTYTLNESSLDVSLKTLKNIIEDVKNNINAPNKRMHRTS